MAPISVRFITERYERLVGSPVNLGYEAKGRECANFGARGRKYREKRGNQPYGGIQRGCNRLGEKTTIESDGAQSTAFAERDSTRALSIHLLFLLDCPSIRLRARASLCTIIYLMCGQIRSCEIIYRSELISRL